MTYYKPETIARSAMYIVTSLLTLLIVLTATVWRPAIVSQLNAWKLLPEPEKLTELYFTHPGALPATYVPGQSAEVGFTVHNLESKHMTYAYRIVEEAPDGTQPHILAEGSLALGQNQYLSLPASGTYADVGPRATVVVELTTVHESIDYQVSRSAQ